NCTIKQRCRIPANRLDRTRAHPKEDMRPARWRQLVVHQRPDLAAQEAAAADVAPVQAAWRHPFYDGCPGSPGKLLARQHQLAQKQAVLTAGFIQRCIEYLVARQTGCPLEYRVVGAEQRRDVGNIRMVWPIDPAREVGHESWR